MHEVSLEMVDTPWFEASAGVGVNPPPAVSPLSPQDTDAMLRTYFEHCTLPPVPFRLPAYETVTDAVKMVDTLLIRLGLGGSYGEVCRNDLLRLKAYIDSQNPPR